MVPSHQLSQCCHDWIVKSRWFMCNVCILSLKLTFWTWFSCILHKCTNIYKSKILSSVFNWVLIMTQITHAKDFGIFSALAMEILQSCAKPWICVSRHEKYAGFNIDGLMQERLTPLLIHWSYVFLALTHQYTTNVWMQLFWGYLSVIYFGL